jgi:hypothetical protein
MYKNLNVTPRGLHAIDPINKAKDREIFDKLGLNINDFLED